MSLDPNSATYQHGEALKVLDSVRERLAGRVPNPEFRLVPPDPEIAQVVDYLLKSPPSRIQVHALRVSIDPEVSLSTGLINLVREHNSQNVFRAEVLAEIARSTECGLTKRLAYCLMAELSKPHANPRVVKITP